MAGKDVETASCNVDYANHKLASAPTCGAVYEERTLRIASLMGGSSHQSVHTSPPWSGILDDVINGYGSRGQHCRWRLLCQLCCIVIGHLHLQLVAARHLTCEIT